jgi:transcriptional regulator with XRE-family HTH domain
METVGDRLREERVRIGLSQEELAAVGGLRKQAQLNYESGSRSPDANYLLALAEAGVDIVYVLKGERVVTDRNAVVLNEDEREILRKYRLLNEAGKGSVEAAMNGYLLAGVFTKSGKPETRVPRLAVNRAAAMDAETADLLLRATDDQRQGGETPAKKRSKKTKG